MAGTTDTVPAKLTPGEFVIKRESAKMLGLPFLRKLNEVSDNAAHDNIDALIAQAELSNMKPMLNGGNVVPGYENGGGVEKQGLLSGLLSMLSGANKKQKAYEELAPQDMIESALAADAIVKKISPAFASYFPEGTTEYVSSERDIPMPAQVQDFIDVGLPDLQGGRMSWKEMLAEPEELPRYMQGYQEGDVVKDDDPLQIDMRMADPSIYNRSVISGKFGDERGIPDAWMQPATEPMPTPEQEAKFLEELNKIKIQQLIEKLKEEQIFNPTEIGGNMDGTSLKQAIIKEKTNSSGEKWSNFLQTLPYIENNQSLQFPPSILNRPPLPK